MQALAQQILGSLRAMDAEAVPRSDGKLTGLWWYGGHARPELKRPQTEVEWSRRLAALLSNAGYTTRRETAYPGTPRDRCDLVALLPDGRRVWIEVKGAWKDYWVARRGHAIFRGYLLHPLVPYPALGKRHTAALDLEKLGRLGPSSADLVAFLLVGFDRPDAPLDADLAEFVGLAGLGRDPWSGATDSWTDVQQRGVHPHVWWREVR
jgi:hypothetical protein